MKVLESLLQLYLQHQKKESFDGDISQDLSEIIEEFEQKAEKCVNDEKIDDTQLGECIRQPK